MLLVLFELFLFIVIILYVFLGIGLELFAIASLSLEENYFEQFQCSLVSVKLEELEGCVLEWSCPPSSSGLHPSSSSSPALPHPRPPPQVLLVLGMLMLFVIVICYVFLIFGLEMFAISSNKLLVHNYFQHYNGCELVRKPGLAGAAPIVARACPLFRVVWQPCFTASSLVVSYARAGQCKPSQTRQCKGKCDSA